MSGNSPKMSFMDAPKLNLIDSTKLPPIPGTSVPGESIPPTSESSLVGQVGGRRKSVSSKGKGKGKKPASSRKGGALIDDVKNLAVPFAILLAKQGLQTMFDKKKPASAAAQNSQLSAKVASQPASTRRRSTVAGGSCGSAACASTNAVVRVIESPFAPKNDMVTVAEVAV